MNTKKFQISFKGIPDQLLPEAHKIVQTKLFELGYVWSGTGRSTKIDNVHARSLQVNLTTTGRITFHHEEEYSAGGKCFTAFGQETEWVEFASDSDVVKIQLNSDYTAEVSKDGIKVGCQTFPLEVVKQLAAAVKKVSKKI